MRIWLQNFVSIQTRTSLKKSVVSWPIVGGAVGRRAVGHRGAVAVGRGRHRVGRASTEELSKSPQICRGSFSSVSTATIASKDAFCSIFRDLQDLHSFRDLNFQFFQIFETFQNFRKFSGEKLLSVDYIWTVL